jgi:hypothetical protein
MYRFTQDGVDLDELRARLHKMTDEELIRRGKAGRYMLLAASEFRQASSGVFRDPATGDDCGMEEEASPEKRIEPRNLMFTAIGGYFQCMHSGIVAGLQWCAGFDDHVAGVQLFGDVLEV